MSLTQGHREACFKQSNIKKNWPENQNGVVDSGVVGVDVKILVKKKFFFFLK
jgi:hypothetical protein